MNSYIRYGVCLSVCLSVSYVQAEDLWLDFKYTDDGAYDIKRENLWITNENGNVLADIDRRKSANNIPRVEKHYLYDVDYMEDVLTADQIDALAHSRSGHHILNLNYKYNIYGGETKTCEITIDPTKKYHKWSVFSKGQIKTNNRCRERTFEESGDIWHGVAFTDVDFTATNLVGLGAQEKGLTLNYPADMSITRQNIVHYRVNVKSSTSHRLSIRVGGADGQYFAIEPVGTNDYKFYFINPPNFYTPLDGDGDNVYEFTVVITDATISQYRQTKPNGQTEMVDWVEWLDPYRHEDKLHVRLTVHEEPITLTTQDEINQWGDTSYPGIIINGHVVIGGEHNSEITDLSGLNNIEGIKGDLIIHNNDKLTTLLGLENLKSVGGELNITNNAMLTTVHGLSRGLGVNSFTLGDNPLLTDCSALKTLLDLRDDGEHGPGGIYNTIRDVALDEAGVYIYDNGENCSSLDEILDKPPSPFTFPDIPSPPSLPGTPYY